MVQYLIISIDQCSFDLLNMKLRSFANSLANERRNRSFAGAGRCSLKLNCVCPDAFVYTCSVSFGSLCKLAEREREREGENLGANNFSFKWETINFEQVRVKGLPNDVLQA